MSRMLVNHKQLTLKLNKPVGLEDLANKAEAAAALGCEYLLLKQIQLDTSFSFGHSCFYRKFSREHFPAPAHKCRGIFLTDTLSFLKRFCLVRLCKKRFRILPFLTGFLPLRLGRFCKNRRLYPVPHRSMGKFLPFRPLCRIFCLFHQPIGISPLLFKGFRHRLFFPLHFFLTALFPQLRLPSQRSLRDHLPALQCLPDRLCQISAKLHGLAESHIHFCGMHIHVHLCCIHLNVQHAEGKFVLHQILFIPCLQRF